MSHVILKVVNHKVKLILGVAAILVFVAGSVELIQRAEASNPEIGQPILLVGPDGELLDHGNSNLIAIYPGDTSVNIGLPVGGTVEVSIDGAAGSFTRDGQSLVIDFPPGASGTSYTVAITFIDAGGNFCIFETVVNRTRGIWPKPLNQGGVILTSVGGSALTWGQFIADDEEVWYRWNPKNAEEGQPNIGPPIEVVPAQ